MERRASSPAGREAPDYYSHSSTRFQPNLLPAPGFPPHPPVIQRIADQPRSYRILQHVIDLVLELLFSTQRPIKRFLLPHSPLPTQLPIDAMRRCPFNRLHDLRNTDLSRIGLPRRQCRMHVSRHHHHRQELIQMPVARQTRIEYKLTTASRQFPSLVCAESDEKDFSIWLIVRQPSTVFIFAEHIDLSSMRTARRARTPVAPPTNSFSFRNRFVKHTGR